MDKKLFLISVLVVAVFTGIYYFYPAKDGEKNDAVVLVLDYGNSQKQSFKLVTEERNRAWSLLQQVAAISSLNSCGDK